MTIENLHNELLPIIKGTIEDTGERCAMQSVGYWIGAKGRHITSYVRVDKKEPDGISRQYSMDRQHHFWIETEEDRVY